MAPPPDYITLADAKAWLEIDPADTTRDSILGLLITAASNELFTLLGWDFRLQTWDEVYNGHNSTALAVNQHPIVKVNSLAMPATASPLNPGTYTWDETCVYLLNGRFPRGPKLIKINYDAGLEATPAWAQLAAQYTVRAMWQGRKMDMNSTGEQFTGIGGSSYWPSGPGAVPPSARSIIEPYRDRLKVPG